MAELAAELVVEPVRPDPAETDPVRPDPAETDPVRPDPAETDPALGLAKRGSRRDDRRYDERIRQLLPTASRSAGSGR